MNKSCQFPFTGLILSCLFIISCATPEPTSRGSRPNHESSAPAYVTDEVLARKIQRLEAELVTKPNDTIKLVQLAGMYIDLNDNKNALLTLEKVKALNYQTTPKVYASLGQLYNKGGEFIKASENYKLFRMLVKDNASVFHKNSE